MKKIVRQVVGLDVSKDKIYVCYKVLHSDDHEAIKGTKCFDNNSSGFKGLAKWTSARNKTLDVSLLYVMEATGVYHEELAYFLYESDCQVLVSLGKKVKHFAKGEGIKTKNDKVDAKILASYGLSKRFKEKDFWCPLSPNFKVIRDICREHSSITNARSAAKNQLHALHNAHEIYAEVIAMKKAQIAFFTQQIEITEKMLYQLVEEDTDLAERIGHIQTTRGLGFMTIIKVVAETNGFLLFKNIRQLVSYAGLDVVENESGKHKGTTKISKQGNARIRAALYNAAMSATQYNTDLKVFYERINEGRIIKKQGIVAVMRKLLILIYTLWNKKEDYIENYAKKTSKTEVVGV